MCIPSMHLVGVWEEEGCVDGGWLDGNVDRGGVCGLACVDMEICPLRMHTYKMFP